MQIERFSLHKFDEIGVSAVEGITFQLEPLCEREAKKWKILGCNSPLNFRLTVVK